MFYYASSSDAFATKTGLSYDDDNQNASAPAIAADSGGDLHVAYQDS